MSIISNGPAFPVGPTAKLSQTPAWLIRHSPLYGEHTVQILSGIGYTDLEIRELEKAGVLVTPRLGLYG